MNKFIAMAMAGAAMTCAASAAQAVTFTASQVSLVYSNVSTGDLHKTSNPSTYADNVAISPQTLRGTFSDNPSVTVDLFGYCVDIFETSGTGTFNIVPLTTYLSAAKANVVAALINAQGDTKNKTHDAAVQLAIWEIINETRGTYDLDKMSGSAGQFWVDDFRNNPGTIKTLAETFITAAVAAAGNSTQGLNIYVAQSLDSYGRNNGKQDMLYWTRTAVPEPATWGMMLLGLGLVGHAMRRRNTRTAVSFS